MKFFLRHIAPWLLVVLICCLPAMPVGPCVSLPDPQPLRARLIFAGDLMQHMPQVTAAQRDTTFDYAPVFEALRWRFEAADMVVVNLETTLTDSHNYSGYPTFRSPLVLAWAMREAGIDVAVMANNHCLDGGARGVRITAAELDRCGIARTGVFADSLDRERNNPLRLERCGIRFALLNYTYGTNGISTPRGIIVNGIDTAAMAVDLAAARDGNTDCVVVCMHWGEEYARRESASQRHLAAFLRRHGADVIIGSHPHVIQPIAADSTHVVAWSLGNFVSNQRKRYTDGGLLVEVDVVKHPCGRISYVAHPVPVWVALPDYRILPPEAADTMHLGEAYRIFREDTNQLLRGTL